MANSSSKRNPCQNIANSRAVIAITVIIVLIASLNTVLFFLPTAKAIPKTSFPRGVASGEVRSNSAVLWTRANQETPIQVEVSTNPNFMSIDFKHTVIAQANIITTTTNN